MHPSYFLLFKLSPAASSLKRHKYCSVYIRPLPLNLYNQFRQFNTFNPLISDPFDNFLHCLLAHFASHLFLHLQWFSSLPYKRKQNLHLILLVEFFKTQTPIPYIRNLSWQAGKVMFKEKIKTSYPRRWSFVFFLYTFPKLTIHFWMCFFALLS